MLEVLKLLSRSQLRFFISDVAKKEFQNKEMENLYFQDTIIYSNKIVSVLRKKKVQDLDIYWIYIEYLSNLFYDNLG